MCGKSFMHAVIMSDHLCAQVMDALIADKGLGANLNAPSISHGSANLYMRGPLEEATRHNLAKVISFTRCLWDAKTGMQTNMQVHAGGSATGHASCQHACMHA